MIWMASKTVASGDTDQASVPLWPRISPIVPVGIMGSVVQSTLRHHKGKRFFCGCGFSGMKLRILIAPDKFKGTLTAPAAATAMARGWNSARPGDQLRCLPISDGGDGFGEV